MQFLPRIRGLARQDLRNICLPESFDDRVLEAADVLLAERLTNVTLIGNPDKIADDARRLGIDIAAVEIIDPTTDTERDEYVGAYVELRKHKGMTPEKAEEVMSENIYYAAMCVRTGRCDGMVGGSVASSADLIRALLQVIRPKKGIKTVSSCFIMVTRIHDLGADGAFIFSDSALIPEPTAEMLVDIAASSAETCRTLLEVEPMVAFLSYSTKGSGKGSLIDKMRRAAELFREAHPEIKSDGEMQADAAIVPAIAERKSKDSPVGGRCNVLIFPDLNVGNISYKLVERLGAAQAIGPIVQGLTRPGNDLSRGCKVIDIVNTAVVTSLQARALSTRRETEVTQAPPSRG